MFIVGNKVSQEFLFNYTGWIASPDYDNDLLYDFNVHYVWKIIAAIPTEVVSVVPFLVDLISYIDETGACIGDKIEVTSSVCVTNGLVCHCRADGSIHCNFKGHQESLLCFIFR